jgi:hypothetical protein
MQVEKIYVVKMGEVVLITPDGRTVADPAFVKEAGGFTFFGDSCLEATTHSPYTVRVRSQHWQWDPADRAQDVRGLRDGAASTSGLTYFLPCLQQHLQLCSQGATARTAGVSNLMIH